MLRAGIVTQSVIFPVASSHRDCIFAYALDSFKDG